MSIEQKIADLLEESAKLKLMEEVVAEELTLEDYSVEELEEYMMTEDFEQLDELSKKTLVSYAQKAHPNMNKQIRKADMSGNNSTAGKEAEVKVAARIKGLHSAVGKLGKDHLSKDITNDVEAASEHGHYASLGHPLSSDDKGKASSKKFAKKVAEDINVQEDVDALLFGEDLTEEFKVKAATIFEAAVMARVNAEVATLEEAFKTSLAEQAEIDKEEIIEKVDGYLGYVVEQWMSDNEIAIENGLKSDILEGFVDGLKTLFVEHYIEVPEERFDVVGDLQEQVEFLESKLDESLEQNVSMMKELNERTRDAVTGDFCSDMTDTEVEKFVALAEELSYEDADNFASKLQIIKENYFGKKPLTKVESVVTDSPVQLNEEAKPIDASVARYLETFNRIK